MNKIFVLVCKWLLVSVLFAAPVAMAKHQLDHIEHIQTAEPCDLCSHAPSTDNGDLSQHLAQKTDSIGRSKPNSIILQLPQQQEHRFLSRAPPLN